MNSVCEYHSPLHHPAGSAQGAAALCQACSLLSTHLLQGGALGRLPLAYMEGECSSTHIEPSLRLLPTQ
jgi:hypothetical protein